MSPDLNPGTWTPYDDPKLMPLYTRSLSSSPPRTNLSPEQRELKRQRDQARRDSKARVRRVRSSSNSYVASQKTTPDLLPRTLPEFQTTLTPAPLLSQSSTALTSPSFMSPYTPQVSDPGPPDIYGPVFTMLVFKLKHLKRQPLTL